MNHRKDATLYALIMEFIIEIVTVDKKLFVTTIWLFFRPGMLTRAHYLGIRNKFFKPLTILSATIGFFYLFFSDVSLFYESFDEMAIYYQKNEWSTSNVFHYNIAGAVREKSETINKSVKEIVKLMEERSETYSKWFFWIIWPLWGWVIWKMLKRYHPNFNYSLICSAHAFGAYLIIWLVLATCIFKIQNGTHITPVGTLYINIPFVFYIILYLKNAFKVSITRSIFSGMLASLAFFLLIILFRQVITIIAFLSITS